MEKNWQRTHSTTMGADKSAEVGMAIPRNISLLEESRNRGMAIWHSSGIEEDEIYSSGSSRNFEEWFYSILPSKTLKVSDVI